MIRIDSCEEEPLWPNYLLLIVWLYTLIWPALVGDAIGQLLVLSIGGT